VAYDKMIFHEELERKWSRWQFSICLNGRRETTKGFLHNNEFPAKIWTIIEAHIVLQPTFMASTVGLFASEYVCFIITTINTPFIPFSTVLLTLSPP
jgi:hypothetical protein